MSVAELAAIITPTVALVLWIALGFYLGIIPPRRRK